MAIIPINEIRLFKNALPFWLSLGLIPLILAGAYFGGLVLFLPPIYAWGLFTLLDAYHGANEDNPDTSANESDIFWYRAITLIWPFLQVGLIFFLLWYVPQSEHLRLSEKIGVFFGLGIATGSIGINYSHELMHQKSKFERWLADISLATVLYSHFRSEHLRVHHIYVGTPRDQVTARFNESFWLFFCRVSVHCLPSAFMAEKAFLARRKLPLWHHTNPFWRYTILQILALGLAFFLGGWAGIGFFLFQAFIAVLQLELVDYIEHYGLTRRHLGDGKYEHVKPHHSWNADHKATNWLLINLQRHSDHHYKPDRRFPLLQTYDGDVAPQLPYGYPVMTMAAVYPPLWRRMMNPRLKAWRARFYPDISDWTEYNQGTTPMPR